MPTHLARCATALIAILMLFGCGGGGSSNDTPPTASVPENLRGQWETVLTYTPAFYGGPLIGTPEGDGSIGVMFYIGPDGRYQHRWMLSMAYFGGNCFRTARWDEFGTLSGGDSNFTFNPAKASFSQLDTCGQSKNIDSVPVIPADHRLTPGQDNAGWPMLRMGFPNGDLVLEKCRRCQ